MKRKLKQTRIDNEKQIIKTKQKENVNEKKNKVKKMKIKR